MTTIQASLPRFTQSLQEKNYVVCDLKTLSWDVRSGWINRIYEILGFNEQRLEGIGKSFCSYLDTLEKRPALFGSAITTIEGERSFYCSVLQASDAVKQVLGESKSSNIRKQLIILSQKVAALQYRIESINGGKDAAEVDLSLKNKMLELAKKWKQETAIFIDKGLKKEELDKLEKTSQFPDFCHLLLSDKAMQQNFFSWAFKDNMDVLQFIQFPATMLRIKTAFLATRVGRLGPDMLRVEMRPESDREEGQERLLIKIVALPFDLGGTTEYLNILDESKEVNLHGTWKLTIKDIFDKFSNKNKAVGDVEYFKSKGITVWNSFELSRWNEEKQIYDYVDLKKEEWWRELPVLEEVTKKELEKKYSVQLKEGEWLAVAKAGREFLDFDLNKNHGFLEICIPEEKGTYKTYPFGSYPTNYPETVLQGIKFIADTKEAKISYPDENIFYTHRQIASFPKAISKEQGFAIMCSIREDLINARNKSHIFQFAGDNCAYWAQVKMKAAMSAFPNLYQIKIVRSTSHNPVLNFLLGIVRKAPVAMRSNVLSSIYTLLGGRRVYAVTENGRKKSKSLLSATSWKGATIHHPASLHEIILSGKLKGVVSAGHG